ncbi:vascular cell adhesion protein 1-like [Sebastes umbrosus]|uniref:vascular cell adhesion protein 1-like n=1 Tax=Sebastes umbrosus TaxID=72105 RepID=UPI0018A06D32|nr:vascular cell adhesion protein 1-like [Sebastes umbrosus]
MFFCYIFLVVSLMNCLQDFQVSSCDENCADKPVFTPSRLVVKFGDPASASCSVCQHACLGNLFDVESPVGYKTTNGTTVSWRVDRLTEWGSPPICYYNNNITNDQCCTYLPITVYQPPDNVSISFVDLTGPMFEGHQYTLQCTVQHVAPVQNLTVTFYRGQTALGQRLSKNNTEKKPVTEIFTLNITPSKEDDGAQFWCDAKLELGPEGPQLPPVVMSQNITTIFQYEPHLVGSLHPDWPIIGAVGDQNSGEGQGQSGMGPCYKVQSSTSCYWRGQAGTWQVTGWSLLLLSLLSGFGQGTEQTNPRKSEHEGSHVPGAELSLELGRTTSNPVIATIVRRVEPPPNTLLHTGVVDKK